MKCFSIEKGLYSEVIPFNYVIIYLLMSNYVLIILYPYLCPGFGVRGARKVHGRRFSRQKSWILSPLQKKAM